MLLGAGVGDRPHSYSLTNIKAIQGDDAGKSRETMISQSTHLSNANAAAYLVREASTRGDPLGNELTFL